MKTIFHLETDDAQNSAIHEFVFGTPGYMSRKQLTAWLQGVANDAIEGRNNNAVAEPIPTTAPSSESRAVVGGDRAVSVFVPSRGDEEYMYKGKDPELAAACSKVLDGLQVIEQHAWETLEGNRI